MIIKQGEIYLADLNPIKGHEQAGYRPVLVIQNDLLNENLNTTIIAPITSNINSKGKLTTIFLPENNSKLKKDSVALLFQMRAIDKIRLKKYISCVSPETIFMIKDQLRFLF